jgi:SET domain-containing protein
MRITPPHKIYISNSPIHGYGVFAGETIYPGEVIEETPIFDLGIERVKELFNFESEIPFPYGSKYFTKNKKLI